MFSSIYLFIYLYSDEGIWAQDLTFARQGIYHFLQYLSAKIINQLFQENYSLKQLLLNLFSENVIHAYNASWFLSLLNSYFFL